MVVFVLLGVELRGVKLFICGTEMVTVLLVGVVLLLVFYVEGVFVYYLLVISSGY